MLARTSGSGPASSVVQRSRAWRATSPHRVHSSGCSSRHRPSSRSAGRSPRWASSASRRSAATRSSSDWTPSPPGTGAGFTFVVVAMSSPPPLAAGVLVVPAGQQRRADQYLHHLVQAINKGVVVGPGLALLPHLVRLGLALGPL